MKINLPTWFFIGTLGMASALYATNGNPCANQSPGSPSQPPCGGGSSGGGSSPCQNEDSSPPPSDCNSTNVFSAYSGNSHRRIVDLSVFGSVGQMPLQFMRYSNTRQAPQASSQSRFGRESVWTHNYQWFMRDGGTFSNGQPSLRVGTPSGADFTFAQDSVDPTLWIGTANANWEIRQNGTEFAVRNMGGEIFRFQKRTNTSSGAVFYRIESMEDSIGNNYTFSYSNVNDTLVRQITDPSGRWLKVTYLNQGGFAQQRVTLGSSPAESATGVWNEVTVTNTTACRFLTLFYANDFTNDPALPVSEIEFYDENNNLITGTPFGSDPYWVDDPMNPTEHESAKAFDGDTATYYRYAYMRNGYVGLDLGAGVTKRVSRIRYFIPSGVVANVAAASFIGMNEISSSNFVVKEVQASDGRKVIYNYSTYEDPSTWFRWGYLASVSYPDSSVALYSYQQVHDYTRPILQHSMDPRIVGQGGIIEYGFDPDTALGYVREERSGLTGEVIASTDFISAHKPQAVYANGNTVTFEYNSANANITKFYDSAGRTTNFTFDAAGAGHVATRKDARGFTYSYTRTPLGNLLSKTHPDGTVESWTRDSRERVLSYSLSGPGIAARTTTYTRDTSGRVTRVDYPDSSFEEWTYNSYGQVLTHRQQNGGIETSTYSANGLLLTFTNAENETTTYAYNALDLVQSVTDPLSRVTSYTLNDRGQITTETLPAVGGVTSTRGFAYDDYGNLISQTNELNHTWTRTYDEFKRVIAITDPLGRTTTISYGEPGGGCSACNKDAKPVLITLPSGRQTKYGYDIVWRLLTQTEGYGTAEAATTTYAYDSNDNVRTIMDPEGRITTMTYDNRDRRLSVTDPLLRRTDYTYDAANNLLTQKRPGSVTTTFTYDSMDRRLTTVDPKLQTTTFQYDAEGNLTHLTDARGNAYLHAYDLENRQTRLTYPDTSYEEWTYDDAGNRATYRTRAGQVMTAGFDARDREIAQNWSAGAPNITRSFDAAGRLQSSSNGSATTSYSYDSANQVLSETQATAGAPAAWTVSYTYNADGLRQSLSYPSGEVVDTTYTARNQIDAISAGGPPPVADYSYHLDGTLASKTLETGAVAIYGYDAANQLLNVTHSQGATTLQQRAYTYNSRGLRTAMQINGGTWDVYGYDLTDQVTSVKYSSATNTGTTPASTLTYTYDAVGNRTQVRRTATGSTTVTNPYGTANSVNQYPTVNSGSVAHDGNGNLTSAPANFLGQSSAQSASYDARNRLISITTSSGTVTQVYDTKNRVVSRTINGTTTYFVWDGWNLIEERDAAGNELRRYVHGADVDEILVMIDAGGAHYHHHDALGNVIALTNGSGALEETYRYDAFGKVTVIDASTNATADSSFFGNRFLYTGREWIAEAGLYDYRNRVYSASLGRFLQTDPIRFAAGDVNIYRYVGNMAVSLRDPQGLATVNNNTSSPVTVSGNVGGNHGEGDQQYGVVQPGKSGGGPDNPIPAYPTPEAARDASDPNFVGPHQSTGNITDVDNVQDPHSGKWTKIDGDEQGPETDINPTESDPSLNGDTHEDGIATDMSNLGWLTAAFRRVCEKAGF